MLMSTLPLHVVNPRCRCPSRRCRCWIPFLCVDVVDFLLSMLLSEGWCRRTLIDEPLDVKLELVVRMPDEHPTLFLLRWGDVVGAILSILLLTTDAVVVVVAAVVYLVVDEAVGCHLVQPLDVEVLLCLCFDVVLVDRWADDAADPFFPFDVPFSSSDGRFVVDLGAMQVCFDDLLVLLDVLLLLDVLFSSTFAVVLADVDVVALVGPFFSFDVAEVVLFDALGAMQV